MATFVKIYGSKLITSSLWDEPPEARLVFLAMLALADYSGYVDVPNERALARVLNLEEAYVVRALEILTAPDKGSRSPDLEGRRVVRDGSGWRCVNHGKYRDCRTPAQEATRIRVAEWREKNAVTRYNVTTGNGVKHSVRTDRDQDRDQDRDPEGSGSVLSISRDLPLAPSSAEPDSSPAVLEFPTAGKVRSWSLRELRVTEWREAFPALDVTSECRKALAWVNASPRNRKTATGMAKFLVSWLSRAQDKGHPGKSTPAPSPYCDTHQRGFRNQPSHAPLLGCPECKHVAARVRSRTSEPETAEDIIAKLNRNAEAGR